MHWALNFDMLTCIAGLENPILTYPPICIQYTREFIEMFTFKCRNALSDLCFVMFLHLKGGIPEARVQAGAYPKYL